MAKFKVLITILSLSSIIYLTGCKNESYRFNAEELESKITAIEIIKFTNYDEIVYDTILAIDGEHFDEFLAELSSIEYSGIIFGSPVFPSGEGECILLRYDNGDFEIFEKDSISKFDQDKKLIYSKNLHVWDNKFDNLINKFKTD